MDDLRRVDREPAKRNTVALPELDQRLVAYALAAGAALAAAPAANAGIVYVSNPTPNTLTVSGVNNSGSMPFFTVTGLPSVPSDTPLFSVVIKGFSFGAYSSGPPYFAGLGLIAYGLQPGFTSNFILGTSFGSVAALPEGVPIPPCGCSSSFYPNGAMMVAFAAYPSIGPHLDGQWANKTAFMALSFGTYSSYFFGWARFEVIADTSPTITVRLVDYAYQDQPFVGITTGEAPEPGSLGLLALGAAGLAAWRKRRKAQE